MHRILVDSASLGRVVAELSKSSARHLHVIRPKDSEVIELFDGHGLKRIYRYEAIGDRLVAAGELEDFRAERTKRRAVHLFACVTKGSRWDWTIEKATELGATKIIPVISERTIVRLPKDERKAKRARWLRIAEDASRQSSALFIPEICEAVDFKEALEMVSETECFAGALTDEPSEPLASALEGIALDDSRPIAAFIGPEGDFTPQELEELLKRAKATNFGKLVLRAETAAIFALSAITAILDKKISKRKR